MNDRQKAHLADELRQALSQFRRYHVEVQRLDVIDVMRVMQDVCITAATDTDGEIEAIERARATAPAGRAMEGEGAPSARPVSFEHVAAPAGAPQPVALMTDKQANLLRSLWASRGLEPGSLDQECQTRFGTPWSRLTVRQASQMIDSLNNRSASPTLHRAR